MLSFATFGLRPAILIVGLLCVHLNADNTLQPPANLPKPPPLPPELAMRPPPEPPENLPSPSELMAQLRQLDELLQLSPDQLRKLRETILVIEKMSPAERESMRIRLSQVTRMTPELRKEIRNLSTYVAPNYQAILSQYWLSITTEARKANLEKLAKLSDAQKNEWLTQQLNNFKENRDKLLEEMKNKP